MKKILFHERYNMKPSTLVLFVLGALIALNTYWLYDVDDRL